MCGRVAHNAVYNEEGTAMMTVNRLMTFLPGLLLALVSTSAYGAASVYAVAYPGDEPGRAEAREGDGTFVFSNEAVEATWRVGDGGLRLGEVGPRGTGQAVRVQGGSLFRATLMDGGALDAADFEVARAPELARLEGRADARRLAERFGGWKLATVLRTSDGKVEAEYAAELRDGSNYITLRLTLRATGADLPVEEITLLDVAVADAEVAGTTQGAPVVCGGMFFALEHPMALNRVEGDRVVCGLRRHCAVAAGAAMELTAVIGVTPDGQLRRGFLYYVERERAHPYRPFLHYNSWYDIAWADRKFNDAQALEAIHTFGEKLIRGRNVVMDSFVFDDGWDDNQTLWQFHDGFPNGFAGLKDAAAQYGSAVGAWLSPFGGYGGAREQRLAYAREQGFETNENGFSLGGPKYYERFKGICAQMIRDYGVNFFKFDGMGTGGQAMAIGGGDYFGDIEALMRLVGELRALAPDLYVSATTGTWCSPYFLWHADSTWRGEGDMGFHGEGSKRQQWITYRDTYTYRNVVRQGPLYPLNSLMTQGIAQAWHGPAAELGDDIGEWGDEVWSFFGSGTGLQELYIAPRRLTDVQWDVLAEAARWARAHAGLFVDTHWVGGDPGAGEVYGWASWTPEKAILVLRNPASAEQSIAIDVARALELPSDAAQRYRVTLPRAGQIVHNGAILAAGEPFTFRLAPFQVLVFELAAEPR